MAADRMLLEVRGTTAGEAAMLIPALRPYVSMEIAREGFLFVQGIFTGTHASLERLRGLLADPKPAEVTMVCAESLAGLYGKQVPVMALLLDPSGNLGT